MRLDVLSALLRDVLMCTVGLPHDRLVNSDVAEQIEQVARKFTPEDLLARAESVRVARELLARNVNGGLVLEHLATELAPGVARAPIQLPKV